MAEQNTDPDPESPASPAGGPAPADDTAPAGDTAPTGAAAPADSAAQAGDAAPTSDAAPAGDTAPTADVAPADGAAPAGGGRATRLGWGVKEMTVAVGVLVIAILALAAITHSFTFSPGSPSTDVSAGGPSVDPTQQYQLAVGQVHFPLRQPGLPAGWRANSADLDQIGPNGANGQPNALRIGFITPAGRYVSLSESSASATDLASQAAGQSTDSQMATKGTVDVDGKRWTIYQGTRSEVSWALDLGQVRILITGNGDQAEFTTMAKAVQTAPIVPTRGA